MPDLGQQTELIKANPLALQPNIYIRFCDTCQRLGMTLLCEHCGSPKTVPVRKIKDRIYEFEEQDDGQRI